MRDLAGATDGALVSRKPTRRQRLEEREQAILDAAHRVFSEQGFDGAKMARIARQAKVAEGTVYLYFKSKSALLEAVVARFYERLTAGAQAGVRDLAGTFERFEFLARHHLGRCIEEWHVLELIIGRYRRLPDYESHGYRFNKTYVAVFDDVFREGVARGDLRDGMPLWVVRDLFYGSLEYSARTLLLRQRGDEEFELAIACTLDILRRGIEGRPPARPADLESVTRRLEAVAHRLERPTAARKGRRAPPADGGR